MKATVKDLREECKNKKIKGFSKLKKNELLDVLDKFEKLQLVQQGCQMKIISEEYSRIINEKVKKVDLEYSLSEDLVYITCETVYITLSGVHFSDIVQLSTLDRINIKKFWNDIIGNEIKTIKWWKYKNVQKKYVSINNKEFIIDDDDLDIAYHNLK